MKRAACSRASKILALVRKNNRDNTGTNNVSENNEPSYIEDEEEALWSDFSDLDPTYQPEKIIRKRTRKWIMDTDFDTKKTSKENSIYDLTHNNKFSNTRLSSRSPLSVMPHFESVTSTNHRASEVTLVTNTETNVPEDNLNTDNMENSEPCSPMKYVKKLSQNTTASCVKEGLNKQNGGSSYSEEWSTFLDLEPPNQSNSIEYGRTLNWILDDDFRLTESFAGDGFGKEQSNSNGFSNIEPNRSPVIPYIKPITISSSYFMPEVDTSTNNETEIHNCSQIKFKKAPFQNVTASCFQENLNKRAKKRTLCKFCQIPVTNFERHLYRHHKDEQEVQDYLKFPKNTKEGKQMRRNILALLRYEVRFKQFIETENSDRNKLPCAHCKRIVAAEYLRRHYKNCTVKPINKTGQNIRHQAASQTLMACASEHGNVTATLRVKNEVLSKMACDEIGFVARKDPLIRHFGEYYLKKHKRAQVASACSNKMRECSRLLIEMRRRIMKPDISFFQILDPTLFDDVLLCAKAISGYDDEKKNYKAPSLALHLGTTLQQICELTTHLLLKKTMEFKYDNHEGRLKEIKRFRFLVQTQWNNEVSSLALKDLAEKKWNKPVMLPITKDVIKFRNHILETAEKNEALLRNDNTDAKAFKKLVDASLASTILFNRRRIGDVQYVETNSYLENINTNNQTEFLEQLTESEKTLTSSYKRVIAGGKGSRPIVILFPPNIQKYINLILEIRKKTEVVPQKNPYLFAYPGVANHWIRGDVVLKKFARSSNIKNPEIMTSNRLRKQIATLMQIVNLNKNDYSQFAKFMGHTEKTHQEFYEITQDAYQTAKIAKLLNLFDKGKGSEYRNKELVDIDIDPNNVIVEFDDETEIKKNSLHMGEEVLTLIDEEKSIISGNELSKNANAKVHRIRWKNQQKKLVISHFKKHIEKKKAPKKNECEELISKHKDILHNLDWVRIKTFVYNTYTNAK